MDQIMGQHWLRVEEERLGFISQGWPVPEVGESPFVVTAHYHGQVLPLVGQQYQPRQIATPRFESEEDAVYEATFRAQRKFDAAEKRIRQEIAERKRQRSRR